MLYKAQQSRNKTAAAAVQDYSEFEPPQQLNYLRVVKPRYDPVQHHTPLAYVATTPTIRLESLPVAVSSSPTKRHLPI